MSSPAQITANQLNAQRSTGPVTEKGKAKVAANAVKHGLSAAFMVLPHEDQDEFLRFVEDLRAELQPAGVHQSMLVNQMAKAQWQLARAQRLEGVAFDLLSDPGESDDPDMTIVNHILAAGRDPLTIFQRYAAQAERSYYKAYREFQAARKIQNEAMLIAKLDAGLTRRVCMAPTPDSPSYPPKAFQQNKPNSQTPPPAPKPSLRSQMPENLALCL